MRRILVIILPLLAIWLTAQCVDPFDPPARDYEDLLVVNAFLSDDPSSHTVYLSRSYPVDTSATIPENNAIVSIESEEGDVSLFIPVKEGVYQALNFEPRPGLEYTLNIATSDNKIYRSTPQVMLETPPIQKVDYTLETLASSETNQLEQGFMIRIDTEDPSGMRDYYRYEWEETWQIQTPYESFLKYDETTGQISLREERISVCWQYENSNSVNLASTENLSESQITELPVRFVPFSGYKLNKRYSILVKQYAISEESFRFWENIKQSNESTGSLYDAQPFPVTGNIFNTEDQAEPVLGYFEIATVAEKRIYIGRNDVPDDIRIPSLYSFCSNDAGDTLVSPAAVPYWTGLGFLISTSSIMPPGYLMVREPCIDCRLRGDNTKPDFWE